MKAGRSLKSLFFGLPFVFVLLLSFQNCSLDGLLHGQFEVANDGALKVDFSSQGNGGSYDGKIEGFARLVPGFTCDGKGAAFASFQLGNDFVSLYSGCENKTEIPLKDVEFSRLSNNYAIYGDGLFSYSMDLQKDLAKGAFTEAWCQALGNENENINVDPSFEIGIHWEQEGNVAVSRFYTSKEKPATQISVFRRIDIEKVYYYGQNSSLSIQFHAQVPGTHKFPGVYQGMMGGTSITLPVHCHLGGQFDSVAPQLSYSENFQTFIQGKPFAQILPTLNKRQAKFSISPDLPAGLSFNTSTGEISGLPSTLQARKTYVIKALLDFGEISKTIAIGIGTERTVDPACSNDTCSLLKIIEQANAQAPIPAVINFAGSYLWPGVESTISGDIEIRGTNAVFDARGLSRHFSVKPHATLSLSGITLKNGIAGAGGSIYAETATLNLKGSRFENNKATADNEGSGGAVLVRNGSLSVTHSQFLNNTTSWSGGNLFGGAISAENCRDLLITNSEFRDNSSAEGGAIYVSSASQEVFEMSDLILSGNGGFDGAGIYLRSGKVMIKNSLFENNNALIEGGGLTAFWTDQVWLDNNRFVKNSADKGSAISYMYFADWGKFYILNSEIRDNLMNPTTLRYWPMIQGSALNLDGPVVVQNSTIANAIPKSSDGRLGGMSNCSATFTSDTKNSILYLGQNLLNDLSCGNK